MRPLDPWSHPTLTDSEWCELKRSRDRTMAYELAVYAVAIVIGLVVLLVAMGGLDWLVRA